MLRLNVATLAVALFVASLSAPAAASAQSAGTAAETLRLQAGALAARGPRASLGAAAREGLAAGVRGLCDATGVAAWLPSTCARAAAGAVSVEDLRASALTDVTAWITRLAAAAATAGEHDAALARDLAVLEVALRGGSAPEIAAALAARADALAPCAEDAACLVARASVREALAAALSALHSARDGDRSVQLVVLLARYSPALFSTGATVLAVAEASTVAEARVVAFARALAAADVEATAAAVRPWADRAGLSAVLSDALALLSLIEARDQAELRRRLLRLAIEIPSWADGLVLDLGGTVPLLESHELRIDGHLSLGYRFERAGFRAYGSLAEYVVDDTDLYWDLHRWRGGGEGYYRLELGPLELELGADASALVYDSTFVPFDAAPGELLDENSLLVRGGASGRVRYLPTPRLTLIGRLALGLQFEDYDRVTNLTGEPEFIRAQDNWDFQGELDITIGWSVAPSMVRLRLISETSLFTRTVNRVVVASVSDPDVRRSAEVAVELDNDTRLFADLSVAELLGFVPEIHVQLGTVRIEGGSGSQTIAVLAFGAGISRVLL